jgi:hypothetical protein
MTSNKSNANDSKTSPLHNARVAGIIYLCLVPLNIFCLFVTSKLVLPGDPAATVTNILASEGLFRSGIVAFLIGQTVFILLPLLLYKLLKPVNKNLALLMVILALAGVPIAFINELNQFAALLLLKGAAFQPDQLNTQVMFFLDMHKHGIMIAQIFWGLWLFPLGYLIFKSGFIPKVFGILLMIGCFGYLIDSFTFFLFPNLDVKIGRFTFIGELLLPLWLVIKGVNVEKWEKYTV